MANRIIDYRRYGVNVAIIGARSEENQPSHWALKAFVEEGYSVFPVNVNKSSTEYWEIEGLPVYQSLEGLPAPVQIAVIYPCSEIEDGRFFPDELVKAVDNKGLVVFQPGVRNSRLEDRLGEEGIRFKSECAIRGLGRHPNDFS